MPPLQKLIHDPVTNEPRYVPLDASDLADLADRQAFAATLQQADDARQADIDLVKKASSALTQLQSDLAGIDTMNAAQTRDVVKHLLTINIGMIKALQRIL